MTRKQTLLAIVVATTVVLLCFFWMTDSTLLQRRSIQRSLRRAIDPNKSCKSNSNDSPLGLKKPKTASGSPTRPTLDEIINVVVERTDPGSQDPFQANGIEKCHEILGTGDVYTIKPVKTGASLEKDLLWLDKKSRSFKFETDEKKLSVCVFDNICWNNTGTGNFVVPISASSTIKTLSKPPCSIHRFCSCFRSTSPIVFVHPEVLENYTVVEGSTWLFDSIYQTHHFGILSQTYGLMSTVTRNKYMYLNDTNGIKQIAYLNLPPPLSPMESLLEEISSFHLSQPLLDPIWAQKSRTGLCFQKAAIATAVPSMPITPAMEGQQWKVDAYTYMGWDIPSCPSHRTTILIRANENDRRRLLINQGELIERLKKVHGLVDVNVAVISKKNSSTQQACTFATSGLVLASHSSQVYNMLFSNPSAVIIEMTPAIYNLDFARHAQLLGVRYHLAFGGQVPEHDTPQEVRNCHDSLASCRGIPMEDCTNKMVCALLTKGDYKDYKTKIKNLDFIADLDVIDKAVVDAIQFMNAKCGGHWPGVAKIA